MKLKISRGEKTQIIDVDFWSFAKCTFIAQLTITGMIYGGMYIFFFIVGMFL